MPEMQDHTSSVSDFAVATAAVALVKSPVTCDILLVAALHTVCACLRAGLALATSSKLIASKRFANSK